MLIEFEDKETFMHKKLSVYSKMFLVVWMIYLVTFLFDPIATTLLLGFTIILGFSAKVPWRKLWSRGLKAIVLPQLAFIPLFMYIFEGSVPFRVYRTVAMIPIGPKISIGTWVIKFTFGGFILTMGFITRGIIVFLTVVYLLYTTLPSELMTALLKLKVPHKAGTALMLMYRFIPTLANTLKEITGAQHCRGMGLAIKKSHNPLNRVRSMLPVMSPLVHEAMAISDRVGLAMETRCFGKGKWTPLYTLKLTNYDAFFILTLLLAAGAITVGYTLYGIGSL